MSKLPTYQVVKGRSGYFNGYLSVGAYLLDASPQDASTLSKCASDKFSSTRVLLIDSTGDASAAKKIDQCGYTVIAIINSHEHADHVGGNSYFQKKNPALKIYATDFCKCLIENSELSSRWYYGAACPLCCYTTRALSIPPSRVTDVVPFLDGHMLQIEGESFKVITLPGHTPGQIGILTPDSVLYVGDAIFDTKTLAKHPIPFYTDIGTALKTLDKLVSLKGVEHVVMYHGGPREGSDLPEIARMHSDALLKVAVTIRSILKGHCPVEREGPRSLDPLCADAGCPRLSEEAILQALIEYYCLPDDFSVFILTKVTVKAYLTYLESLGELRTHLQQGKLTFSLIEK